LANSGMVSITAADVGQLPRQAPNMQRHSETVAQRSGSSAAENPPFNRLLCIGKSLQSRGLSKSAAKLLLSSWRESTNKQNQYAWNKWVVWCSEKQVDYVHPSATQVFNCLSTLVDEGLSHSVVNMHKVMSIQTFNMIGYDELNDCVLISKFMKGVFHNRPPMPKYSF
jgi:hypothetical protein